MSIAGHRHTVFRKLQGIAQNDEIDVTTPHRTYRYRVVSTEVVAPNDVAVLSSSGVRELTLVTCYPFHYIGPAPKRFIVHAVPAA
jgi:sortase A